MTRLGGAVSGPLQVVDGPYLLSHTHTPCARLGISLPYFDIFVEFVVPWLTYVCMKYVCAVQTCFL